MEAKSFRKTNLNYDRKQKKSPKTYAKSSKTYAKSPKNIKRNKSLNGRQRLSKGGQRTSNTDDDLNNTVTKPVNNSVNNSVNNFIHPIRVYKIDNEIDESLVINTTENYRINKLDEIKEKLNNTKNKLDDAFQNNKFGIYWREFDPFKNEKNIIAKLGNTYNVSNAWVKCYEMINYFNMIPDTTNEFLHFDNAAFPGSFIVSTHHLINTQRKWKNKYKWYASSLHDINKTRGALEDKYKLFQNYPDNWLMTKTNDGDVLSKNNQLDFMNRLNHSIDLYTSDLGFAAADDYNNQELIQAPANIGQIISGLLTLKKGGCFITKQYTIFEPITVSAMYATSVFFDEFYICKPYSSREANSELYLVGKGFKGNINIDHPYINAMFDRISGNIDINIPIFKENDYPDGYIDNIIKIADSVTNSQIVKINNDIDRVTKCINANFKGPSYLNNYVLEFKKQESPKLEAWYYFNPIKPIKNNDKLNMIDGLGQK